MNEILLSFGSAGFGAILSTTAPIFLTTLEYGQRKDLLVNWSSEYKNSDSDQGDDWIQQEVKITVRHSSLLIESNSTSNSSLSNYRAKGKIIDEIFIIGRWYWQPRKKVSSGAFQLIITPKSDVIYGYFTSLNPNNQIVYQPWVLAKDEKGIETGKKLLSVSTS